jgi:hypothetical protein
VPPRTGRTKLAKTPYTDYAPAKNGVELLQRWIKRGRESQFCHYEMASLLEVRSRMLGIPVILFTTIVGASIFSSFSESADTRVAVGLLSLAAAVLSSLQTFFNYSDRAEKHRRAAAKFSSVRRRMELHAVREAVDPELMNVFREELDELASESPHVPQHVYSRVIRQANS